jgi:outer membrane lipopolysaccharide assembly protein LptE/RlpB
MTLLKSLTLATVLTLIVVLAGCTFKYVLTPGSFTVEANMDYVKWKAEQAEKAATRPATTQVSK